MKRLFYNLSLFAAILILSSVPLFGQDPPGGPGNGPGGGGAPQLVITGAEVIFTQDSGIICNTNFGPALIAISGENLGAAGVFPTVSLFRPLDPPPVTDFLHVVEFDPSVNRPIVACLPDDIEMTPGDFLLTVSAGLAPTESDAVMITIDIDPDPLNELIEGVGLVGTTVEIRDAGSTHFVDLAGVISNADIQEQADRKAADALENLGRMTADVAESAARIAADKLLQTAIDADPDRDPANELNTSVVLNGTDLEVTDAGGTLVADLSGLVQPGPAGQICPSGEFVRGFDGGGNILCTGQCVAPPSGLVSWWVGDGNALDIQGSNNGTLENGATFSAGKVGQAFSLDGVDDYVSIPDDPTLDNTGEISIALWVSNNQPLGQTGLPFFDHQYLVDKREALGTAAGYAFCFECAVSGEITFGFGDGFSGNHVSSSGLSITPGTFNFFVGTASRSNDFVRLYQNGVLIASGSWNGLGTVTNNGPLHIGSPRLGFGERLNGVIDEVAIFDRDLSSGEIQDIFNADSDGMCKP